MTMTPSPNKEREERCDHQCSGNCRRVGCNCKCGEWHGENYERDHSHIHCWNQEKAACGIPLKDHKQCCLCEKLPAEEAKEGTSSSKYTCDSCGGAFPDYSLKQQAVNHVCFSRLREEDLRDRAIKESRGSGYAFEGEPCKDYLAHEIQWCGDCFACVDCGMIFLPQVDLPKQKQTLTEIMIMERSLQPIGVSQWLEYGKKYGYDESLLSKAKTEEREQIAAEIQKLDTFMEDRTNVENDRVWRFKRDILLSIRNKEE